MEWQRKRRKYELRPSDEVCVELFKAFGLDETLSQIILERVFEKGYYTWGTLLNLEGEEQMNRLIDDWMAAQMIWKVVEDYKVLKAAKVESIVSALTTEKGEIESKVLVD